jgi:hypothetical protein
MVVSSEILLIECQASIIFCSISFQAVKNQKGTTILVCKGREEYKKKRKGRKIPGVR